MRETNVIQHVMAQSKQFQIINTTNGLKQRAKANGNALGVCVLVSLHVFGEYSESCSAAYWSKKSCICQSTDSLIITQGFSGLSLSSVLHIKLCFTTWPNWEPNALTS